MAEKFLGKIVKAQFGVCSDRPYLMGLQLEFRFDGNAGVNCGGRHLININPNCKWDSEEERNEAYQDVLYNLASLLKNAKVNYVSELVGKPVEIEIENQMYKNFRILTEVL